MQKISAIVICALAVSHLQRIGELRNRGREKTNYCTNEIDFQIQFRTYQSDLNSHRKNEEVRIVLYNVVSMSFYCILVLLFRRFFHLDDGDIEKDNLKPKPLNPLLPMTVLFTKIHSHYTPLSLPLFFFHYIG